MRRQVMAAAVWLTAMCSGACSGDDPGSDAAAGGGREQSSGGAGTTGGTRGSADGGGGADPGAGGADAVAGSAGAVVYSEPGVCGQRGQSTVSTSAFAGYEEFYLIGEEGFGEDICVVRFDVARVGAAPGGCADPTADNECLWTHLVEFSNPTLVTDVEGVCASSELGLDAARIAELDGSRAAYGFISEYVGHNSVLMKYDSASDSWSPHGPATWDEATGTFRFDRRNGVCNY